VKKTARANFSAPTDTGVCLVTLVWGLSPLVTSFLNCSPFPFSASLIVIEVNDWDIIKLLEWIREKKPNLLKDEDAEKIKTERISGQTFLKHATGNTDFSGHKPAMFMRKSYHDIYSIVARLPITTKIQILLTGTPGIGKSTSVQRPHPAGRAMSLSFNQQNQKMNYMPLLAQISFVRAGTLTLRVFSSSRPPGIWWTGNLSLNP
jgi:hypothetical protein